MSYDGSETEAPPAIRWRRVLGVFAGASKTSGVALCAVLIAAVVWFFYYQVELSGIVRDIAVLSMGATAMAYAVHILLVWWRGKAELQAAEHRVVFGGCALLLGISMGGVNYAVYLVDPNSFRVDSKAVATWVKARDEALERGRLKDERAAQTSERLSRRVLELPLKELRLAQVPGFRKYRVEPAPDGLAIELQEAETPRGDPSWWTTVRDDEGEIVLKPTVPPYPLIPISGGEAVSKIAIVAAMDGVASFYNERANRQKSARGQVPASAFAYQWLMTVLGENPGYVSPNSAGTRTLEFMLAVLKWLYAGIFITLVLDAARGREGAAGDSEKSVS